MSRRSQSLLTSGVLVALLAGAATAAPVPYVSYTPGPTFDTLGEVGGTPVIAVEGRQTFPTEGQLDLTTISVRPQLTLADALHDWFDRDRAVVPREFLYPPGESDEQVRRRNEERRLASEGNATSAALRHLGIPFTTTVQVHSVEPGLPADGVLEPGDVLTSLDGDPIASSAELRDRVGALEPGTDVRIGYLRDGQPGQVVVTTAAAPAAEARSVVGVMLAELPEYPFEIEISLEDVGGPSAGLMFALGIIEKLEPESLTGGRYIAGTGEIRDDGGVGPIGGIPQKLVAARDQGAEAFLVPADNCAEALGRAPEGLQLIRVASLQEAVDALRTLRDGGTPPRCAA